MCESGNVPITWLKRDGSPPPPELPSKFQHICEDSFPPLFFLKELSLDAEGTYLYLTILPFILSTHLKF